MIIFSAEFLRICNFYFKLLILFLIMKKTSKTAVSKSSKDFYAFGIYKPNKNAKPVTYKGKEYLSKAQCMALEGITRKELDAYLNGDIETPTTMEEVTVEAPEVIEVALEETIGERNDDNDEFEGILD